jgi:hypothetical protein
MKNKMAYREQRFICGDFLEVNIFPVFRTVSSGRSTVRKPTRETQKRLNGLNRARECNRVICANFTSSDYYLTLTFKGDAPDEFRARKDFENFLARTARSMKRKGLPKPKWIKSVEVGKRSGRVHCHLILSGGLSPMELQKLWGRGYIDCKPLMFSADGVMALAKYFVKEIKNEAGDGHKVKSWSCSRNCIRPVPKNNDYRYSKRRAAELALERENSRFLEKLYPEYFFAGCEPFYNDNSGLYYLHLRFYRKNARLDL